MVRTEEKWTFLPCISRIPKLELGPRGSDNQRLGNVKATENHRHPSILLRDVMKITTVYIDYDNKDVSIFILCKTPQQNEKEKEV